MFQITLCTKVRCSYSAKMMGIEPRQQYGIAGTVAGEDAMRHRLFQRRPVQALGLQFSAHLLLRLAQHQGGTLRQAVGDQHALLIVQIMRGAQRQDEIDRMDRRPLVQHLEKRMLAIGANIAP